MPRPWPRIVEVYKTETREVLDRFLCHQLSFPDCIAALDAALASLTPKLKPRHLPELRTVTLANNELVMKEMERRQRKLLAQERSRIKRFGKDSD